MILPHVCPDSPVTYRVGEPNYKSVKGKNPADAATAPRRCARDSGGGQTTNRGVRANAPANWYSPMHMRLVVTTPISNRPGDPVSGERLVSLLLAPSPESVVHHQNQDQDNSADCDCEGCVQHQVVHSSLPSSPHGSGFKHSYRALIHLVARTGGGQSHLGTGQGGTFFP